MITLDKFSQLHPRPEYVFTIGHLEARIALKYFPNCKVIFEGINNTDYIYDVFMNHLSELQKFYESLIDEESKKTFCGYWLGNVSNQFGEIVHAKGAHYFTEGFLPARGAVVIDGGVCDGGTAAKFTEFGYKVYGFEMDRENFQMAKKVAKEKNFVLENFGLGSYKHEMKYTHAPGGNVGGSKLDNEGSETAKITTIDDYVRKNKIPRVDFIKLDVEGAELDVLRGAVTTIVMHKPILAISAYHKWDDFWTLMDFIKSIRSDYEFALRQYTSTREDEGTLFSDDTEDILYSLGLEVVLKGYNECVLLAR